MLFRSSKTFTVQALATLPRGRAIVFSSGAPPVLVRTVPWWEGPYRDAVKKSIEQHDPQRKTLITDVIGSPALVKSTPAPEAKPEGPIEERPL